MSQENLFNLPSEEKLPEIEVIKSKLKEAAGDSSTDELEVIKAGKYISRKKIGNRWVYKYHEDSKSKKTPKKEIGGAKLGDRQHAAVGSLTKDIHGALKHEHGDKLHKMSDKKVQEHIAHKLNEHEVKTGKTLHAGVKDAAHHSIHAKIHNAKKVAKKVSESKGNKKGDQAYIEKPKAETKKKPEENKPAIRSKMAPPKNMDDMVKWAKDQGKDFQNVENLAREYNKAKAGESKPADKKEPAKGKPTPKKEEKGKPAKKEEKKPETKKPEKKESLPKKDEKPKK